MITSVAVGTVGTPAGENVIISDAAVTTALIKQIIFMGAGYLVLWFVNRFLSLRLFSVFQGLAVALYAVINALPLLFPAVNGSRAWIHLPGGLSIQPAEFVKPLMIILIAIAFMRIEDKPKKFNTIKSAFRIPIVAFIIFGIEIALQRDFGTLAIIGFIAFICFILVDMPLTRKAQKLCIFAFIGAFVGVVIVMANSNFLTELLENTPLSHIAVRIDNAKNPYNDPYGQGYQPANALYGIADSGIVGKGFGASSRKFGYLTQAESDYIFAVMIEETGIFGLGLLVLLYGLLIYRLLYYAFKTTDSSKKVILTGNCAYLFIHFALNVGGVSALIPMTGIPLLFISEGGSSLMAICATIGLSQRCISDIRRYELRK